MGQDDSCGICGKHYQCCKHYVKEHIPNINGKALCGRKVDKLVMLPKDWEHRSCDPDDICITCMKIYGGVAKYLRILYDEDEDEDDFEIIEE